MTEIPEDCLCDYVEIGRRLTARVFHEDCPVHGMGDDDDDDDDDDETEYLDDEDDHDYRGDPDLAYDLDKENDL